MVGETLSEFYRNPFIYILHRLNLNPLINHAYNEIKHDLILLIMEPSVELISRAITKIPFYTRAFQSLPSLSTIMYT